jgi:hypothetical protein
VRVNPKTSPRKQLRTAEDERSRIIIVIITLPEERKNFVPKNIIHILSFSKEENKKMMKVC